MGKQLGSKNVLLPGRQLNFRPTLELEKAAADRGFKQIAGVDEAGRGPLAGPVVVAAVILGEAWKTEHQLNDSKKLSEKKREQLFEIICTEAAAYKIVAISAEDIDRLNILQATLLGMLRCLTEIVPTPDYALVDGNIFPKTEIQGEAVVKGDGRSKSIAAASILAKVTRDQLMLENAKHYPEWGFEQHKGYPTIQHRRAIEKYGLSPLHRKSFRLKSLVTQENRNSTSQLSLL
ncbi:MAG: ribonuclease HII [SAR324 cluster bacterium]|nr:ribonuclease HII [SAR324 cluster bacterium]MBL7035739.1 ribonuclease HII [SAR324 cluster bacterium]